MTKTGRHLYEFGAFRLDPSERLLLKEDKPVAITTKAFDALLILLERAGHLVSKAELMSAVWPDSFVEDGNVAVTISTLRKALGDDGQDNIYIRTIAKQGYRFVREVRKAPERELEQPTSGRHVPMAVPPIPESPVPGPLIPQSPIPQSSIPLLSPVAGRPGYRSTGLLVAIALLAVAIVAAASVFLNYRQTSTPLGPAIRSLVVLPFRSSNLDPARDYLRVGMADAIITRLAATGQLVVRPTTAVIEYSNSPADPVTVARSQRVDAALSGNIEFSGERVRVNLQLVRSSDGSIVWAGSLDGVQSRMIDLEHEVEDRVARAIPVRAEGEGKMRSPGTVTQNPEAYRLYLEGRYFWNKRTEQGLRRSIELFQRATLEDQRYAAAFAGLADSYALLASYGVEPTEQAYPNAKAAALKALQLDDQLPEAHTSLGMIAFYYEWNWRQAEQEFRRSIELNPNYALAHTWFALELAALGRSDEAASQIQAAYQLDPLSMSINTEVGRVFYWNRQYERAIDAFRKAVDLDSNFARAHTRLGMAYAAKRDFAAALQEFGQARQLSGPDPYLDGLVGYVQAMSGNTVKARETLSALTSRASSGFVPAFSVALVCIGLGDRAGALEWLARSYQDRSTYLVYANVGPLLDPIRSDPKFKDLLARMQFVSK